MKPKSIREKILSLALSVMLILGLSTVSVGADMGPKPSVNVSFENMGDELCYGTLLSARESTGPYSAWDGNREHIYNYDLDIEIWWAFQNYEDADGYYFLQWGEQVNDTKSMAWTYYPPSSFKILLYFPETDTYTVSGIYERYAFDSYFTVDMDGVNIGSVEYDGEQSGDGRLVAYRSYNYGQELVSFFARVGVTIVIEMAVALLFGFTDKRSLLFLAVINTGTQIVLNVLLNIINYHSGHLAFAVFYVLLEFLVFFLEAIAYCLLMKRFGGSEKPRKAPFYVFYALVANAVSFAAGYFVAQVVPGIF